MSVYHEAPTEVTTPPLGQEPTHGVCLCQVDATPRLALCGTDCSGDDEAESWTDTICVVCFDFMCSPTPCTRCRGRR